MQISRLRVGNEDFLVSSMIERCPKFMMLRELIKNAFESASRAPDGHRRVEIAPLVVDGARKLAIWNTGVGMDASELHDMCDIASSIGKENALDQNFGMGAKVASLPSNTHGIRYRSCKAGRVHQVVMGKRDGQYGRLLRSRADGETAEVLDVTDDAASDGRPVDLDWTEVVLYGGRPDQDTVADPYDGNPHMPAGWIAEELYKRFYTSPADVEFVLKDGCNILGGDRRFAPIGARMANFARHEAVPVERGIVIHYFHDAPDPEAPGRLGSARDALQPAQSSAALIYREEIYDFRPPWAWLHEAPVYGIPFGARNISIYIELPNDFPLLPDGYRQFLRHNHNLQHNVSTREFANLALRHRPAWLLELLRNFAPDAGHVEHLHGAMVSLFKALGIRRRWWPPSDGSPPSEGGGDGIEYEVAPQIVPLRDEADIRERGMEKKAARFYPETHQIFINTTYAEFAAFAGVLEAECAAVEDREHVRRAATETSEHLMTRQICRKLVYGLSKREHWHGWEVDQATSMYSLTLAADDHAGFLEEAREEMKHRLKDILPPDPRIEQARGALVSAMENLLTLRPRRSGAAPMELNLRVG